MPSDAPPLRVLHVAETAQGGVGSYLEDIVALQVARHGEAAVRAVLPREHAAHFKRLPAASLRLFDIAASGRSASMLKMARLALAEVRRWRPEVVHLHSTYAGFVLRPLLMLMPSRPRIVYCAHGWAFDREGSARSNRIVARIERWWSRACDAVVCISRHDAESALRIGIAADRLVTISNGIADAAPPPVAAVAQAAQRWQADTLRVLFVGRLDRQKGVDLLYEAMRRLGPQASGVVVGAAVVAADAAPPPDNVQVTGWLARDEIAALYAAAQVLVVPSRWEGFGLVAVEAMRAGRAVLASRVGGLPEVVDAGVTGALFEPGDATGLADLLGCLPATELAAMGEAGRARVESLFDVTRVVDELDALYRQLLAPSVHAAVGAPGLGATGPKPLS
jgi:glycosyltransferase involved in cell wall biosynthesis